MNELDFTIEMNVEGVSDEAERELFLMANGQLRELADGYNDFVGAAITMREPAANRESPILFEVTIAAYTKPSNTAATSKKESPAEAMQDALDAIKRQIRERRDQQRHPQEQPGAGPIIHEIAQVVAAEEAAALTPAPDDFVIDAHKK